MTIHTLIEPDWPAPSNVQALVTSRGGEHSRFGHNLALTVGDESQAVEMRRSALQDRLQVDAIQWLKQVHGTRILTIDRVLDAAPEADGALTRSLNVGVAVLTADCLPVLFCNQEGTEVAAVHGGWRGLAAGILNQVVAQFRSPPDRLMAWLGPAISQPCFEVGQEVREAFLDSPVFRGIASVESAFQVSLKARHSHADLYQLARLNLAAQGLTRIYGGDFCTFTDGQRFYSYRREAECGRMASVIALRNPGQGLEKQTNSP